MNGAAAPVWNILTPMCFWFWKIFSFKKVDLQSDGMLQGSSVRHISEQHRKLLLKVTWFLNFVNSWTWTLPVFTSSVVFMFRKAENNLFGNNKRCWCNPFCLSAGKTSGLPWTWRDSTPSLASSNTELQLKQGTGLVIARHFSWFSLYSAPHMMQIWDMETWRVSVMMWGKLSLFHTPPHFDRLWADSRSSWYQEEESGGVYGFSSPACLVM